MPQRPFYCRNLSLAITRLGQSPAPWVGRKELQDALEVSKTVAWRILRACGAQPGPGNALVCGRQELLRRLEAMRNDGGKLEFEARRRERLEAYLEQIRPEIRARRTAVAAGESAEAMRRTMAASLPRNVSLSAGEVRFAVRNLPELLAAVGALIHALDNDAEAVAAVITVVD